MISLFSTFAKLLINANILSCTTLHGGNEDAQLASDIAINVVFVV